MHVIWLAINKTDNNCEKACEELAELFKTGKARFGGFYTREDRRYVKILDVNKLGDFTILEGMDVNYHKRNYMYGHELFSYLRHEPWDIVPSTDPDFP